MFDPEEVIRTTRMSGMQWIAVLLCVAVFAIDGFDILAISFAAPGLAAEWGLRPGQLGIVLSLELFGMAFGSMLLGRLADTAGRRKVMIGALSVLCVSMSLCAFARDVVEFAAFRLITGVAIGAVIPALTAMVSESANEKNRDLAVSWMGAGFPIGAITGGLLSSLLLEHFSWRAIFAIGGASTAAVLLLVFFLLPETVAYLARRRPADSLDRINAVMRHFGKSEVMQLPATREAAVPSRGMRILPKHVVLTALPLLAIYSLHLWTYYFILKWLPKIMTDLGVGPSASASSLVWASIGGVLGSAIFGIATAHFSLRHMTIGVMVLSTVAVIIFGFGAEDLNRLVVTAMIASFFTTAGAVGLYSLVARSYSAEWRATGTGLVLGAGRGIAALGPIFTGYLFQSGLTLPFVAAIVGSGSLIGALMIYILKSEGTIWRATNGRAAFGIVAEPLGSRSKDSSMAHSAIGTTAFISRLCGIVGKRNVFTGSSAIRFARGFRFGSGPVAAAVQPGSLVEMWRVVQACVSADRIVIAQAANTGLTGGSTPDGSYDREVVVVSTARLAGIKVLGGGEQVICMAGATLYDLERTLDPLGREPHSVIGSSCIGASVVGGVCNNSGGALVRRGPAYTEYALFGQVDDKGSLRLRNHLGIELGGDPETILQNLEAGRFNETDIETGHRRASAAEDYGNIVRQIDEPTPARFNADPARLFEASGSAGKIVVFAVRLDTFAKVGRTTVFYIGTNAADELTEVRRRILSDAPSLPISGEYIHREAFDLADRYGKDTVAAIRALGTDRLPLLFRVKAAVDRLAGYLKILPPTSSNLLLQAASYLIPDQLPKRMREFRDRYEHHLILKVENDAIAQVTALLGELFPSASGDVFECSPQEAERAMLHRFAVAGAAVRYRSIHPNEVEDIVALDVALPRNSRDWFEQLPADLEELMVGKLYYGHFFCHVFHQDYLVRKGVDAVALEHRLLQLMEERGAEYPAEHNVGHLYTAKPALASHYRQLDPVNTFNPGIGKTSRRKGWQ